MFVEIMIIIFIAVTFVRSYRFESRAFIDKFDGKGSLEKDRIDDRDISAVSILNIY